MYNVKNEMNTFLITLIVFLCLHFLYPVDFLSTCLIMIGNISNFKF